MATKPIQEGVAWLPSRGSVYPDYHGKIFAWCPVPGFPVAIASTVVEHRWH
jgi:hypothetical protein